MKLSDQNNHAIAMNADRKTILIMAGGTGGHVIPALSIALKLKQHGIQTEWLGTRSGLEASVLENTGIPLHFISVQGVRGKGVLKILVSPLMIIIAVCQAMKILINIKPQCVLGMGGFVSGPGGVAARLLGKKLLIHEQNAVAGFSNKMLALIAFKVMEAFPETFKPSNKVVCTGNPVRDDIGLVKPLAERMGDQQRPLNLLVLGGSLGAASINKLVPAAIATMSSVKRPRIMHQAGNDKVEDTLANYREHALEVDGSDIRVIDFIEKMNLAYEWADVVLCRSGAMTVSEIAVAGIPAIFVPYPHAVDDHQTRNAEWLSKKSAALLVQQSELSPRRLGLMLEELGRDRKKLLAMAKKSLEMGQTSACDNVVAQCLEAF